MRAALRFRLDRLEQVTPDQDDARRKARPVQAEFLSRAGVSGSGSGFRPEHGIGRGVRVRAQRKRDFDPAAVAKTRKVPGWQSAENNIGFPWFCHGADNDLPCGDLGQNTPTERLQMPDQRSACGRLTFGLGAAIRMLWRSAISDSAESARAADRIHRSMRALWGGRSVATQPAHSSHKRRRQGLFRITKP